VLVFHAALITVAVAARKHVSVQMALLTLCTGLVLCSHMMNEFLRPRWRELGWSQNYFDEKGVFISIFLSAPLLVVAAIIMVRVRRVRATLTPSNHTLLPPPPPPRRTSCTRSSPPHRCSSLQSARS